MGKIINMDGTEKEVVSVEEARTFFRGRNGECMKRRSFLQMVYRGGIPTNAYTKSTNGNYWFDKNSLIGSSKSNTAA